MFWLLLAAAVAWSALNQRARIQRIAEVTAVPEWSVGSPATDPASPTGYENGRRRLILPEHHYRSFLWIAQTQHMLAEGSWRVRWFEFENAPHGRESHLPSPYAWWLGALATADHTLTGEPLGSAVERAALYADPLVHLLVVIAAVWISWTAWGVGAAVLVVLAGVLWYPLAGNFVAGAPDTDGWFVGANLLGFLALAAAWKSRSGGIGRMAFAGACGGLASWLDAPAQVVWIFGLLLGGATLRGLVRGKDAETTLAATGWRVWGAAGAGVAISGWVLEYAPGHSGLLLETNHPLHAVCWLGAGELMAHLTAGGTATGRNGRLLLGLAAAAVFALPVAWAIGDSRWPWQMRPDVGRLSVSHNLGADHLWAWLTREGPSVPLAATVLPMFAAVSLGVWAWRRKERAPVVLFGCPAMALVALASWQPVWWSFAQVAVVPILLLTVPATAGAGWLWAGLLLAIPGIGALRQPRAEAAVKTLTESELVGLIGRDLAHRLAHEAGGSPLTVWAPPEITGALHYYAGLRGLGTFAWENRDGLTAAARIASATSPEEALHLLEQRGITHLVIPAWDDFLDRYAGLGRAGSGEAAAAASSFVAAIHRWEQPGWLWPRAYPMPPIPGFEAERVEVFAVGDEQDAPSAMSRLAEYFIETGRLDLAASARAQLRRYPAHIGALAATAKVDAARREGTAFAETVARLMPLLEAGGDRRGLPWDRRVSLAIVLAAARETAEATAQLERCVRDASEERLRGLSPQSLFQLLTLMKRSRLEFEQPETSALARSLLPPDARDRL
ncbi:hypothetical protein ASA1KI_02390 [Opitutales bacterium ASA1]|nr:hypothetical protein ASA1KI_02390 [Opitutales bacterium ASA1]